MLILEHLKDQILEHHAFRGDQTIVIAKDRYLAVVDQLFKEGFQLLVDVTAVDWPGREIGGKIIRFDLVCHFLNLANQERLRVKVRLAEDEAIPSLVSRFKTADWYEREVYDMFGIRFEDHPNLQRLLTWADFPGHALRKDFPLDGGDPFCMDGCTAPYNRG